MFFVKTLTIPANTTALQPVRVTFPVCRGLISHVWVRWYWGSGNLCGARMLYQEFQHWPLSIGGWFPSSPYPLDFAEDVVLDSDPYLLTIEGYNLDDTYPHAVVFHVNITRAIAVDPQVYILDGVGW